MKKNYGFAAASLWLLFSLMPPANLIAEETELNMSETLNPKQRKVVVIAAFTASGDAESLIRVLNEGLDAGLTVNEIGEVLLQMYAYAGFPRSLNGMNALSSVLDDRRARGIEDSVGTEPESLPEGTDRYAMGVSHLNVLLGFPLDQSKSEANGYAEAMDAFLKEHLFADIFGRKNLPFEMRELATVGALASLEGTNPQLMFHMNAAMNCGLTESQMNHAADVLGEEIGKERGENAAAVLAQALERRNASAGK